MTHRYRNLRTGHVVTYAVPNRRLERSDEWEPADEDAAERVFTVDADGEVAS